MCNQDWVNRNITISMLGENFTRWPCYFSQKMSDTVLCGKTRYEKKKRKKKEKTFKKTT